MTDPAVIRHHEILDATVADMLERGAHQLNVQRVARAAGIAKGTVYLYFPTRESLAHAALERGLIMDELTDLGSDPTPLAAATLGPFLEALWGALEERDEVVRIVARDGLGVLGPGLRDRLAGVLRGIAGRIAGDTGRGELVARSLVAAVVAAYLADPRGADLPVLQRLWAPQLAS